MRYVCYTENGFQKHYQLAENKMTVFGREDHADFQILNDSLISREHFGIERDERGKYIVIDLGSSNGTFLNEHKLEPNSMVILREGDKIRAGRQVFTYVEKIQKQTQGKLLVDVEKELESGKGYHTVMCEIIGRNKEKMKKKLEDQQKKPSS